VSIFFRCCPNGRMLQRPVGHLLRRTVSGPRAPPFAPRPATPTARGGIVPPDECRSLCIHKRSFGRPGTPLCHLDVVWGFRTGGQPGPPPEPRIGPEALPQPGADFPHPTNALRLLLPSPAPLCGPEARPSEAPGDGVVPVCRRHRPSWEGGPCAPLTAIGHRCPITAVVRLSPIARSAFVYRQSQPNLRTCLALYALLDPPAVTSETRR